MKTKREQVEDLLETRGLDEEAPGDWRGGNVYIRLDIAHNEDTAWWQRVYNGAAIGEVEVVSYDEVIRRLG